MNVYTLIKYSIACEQHIGWWVEWNEKGEKGVRKGERKKKEEKVGKKNKGQNRFKMGQWVERESEPADNWGMDGSVGKWCEDYGSGGFFAFFLGIEGLCVFLVEGLERA